MKCHVTLSGNICYKGKNATFWHRFTVKIPWLFATV